MFNQIVQQNSLVLNMLAKLPSKMQWWTSSWE
jgi:hypothetical protein